jgi:hypothetical protein
MEVENHLIKNLLVSLGFSATLVKRYLQSADQNTVTDRKVAIPVVIKRPVEACSAVPYQSPCTTSSHTSGVPTKENDLVKQPSLNRSVRPASTIPTQGSAEAQRTISPSCKKRRQMASLRSLGLMIKMRSIRPYVLSPRSSLINIMRKG